MTLLQTLDLNEEAHPSHESKISAFQRSMRPAHLQRFHRLVGTNEVYQSQIFFFSFDCIQSEVVTSFGPDQN